MHAKIKLSYPTQLTTQLTAPKTVEWLGIYAQFKGIGLFARGGGLHGDDHTHKHTQHKTYDMPLACHRMDTHIHTKTHNTHKHTQHKTYDMPLACHRMDTHIHTKTHNTHTKTQNL
jgi:hypothetical protein